MRFKINFNRIGKQRMLPIDYQYYISAWIYKVIGKADAKFAEFLHSEGYGVDNKQFKLFCYSPLNFGKPTIWKEKSLFEIETDAISLCVSFHIPEAAENFVVGLFNNQQIFVGDRFNGIDMVVAQIERIAEPALTETMQYKALSPVVVSRIVEGEKYAQYLSPESDCYADLLKANLLNKYQSIPNAMILSNDVEFNFALQSDFRSKLNVIKPYTLEQSKVRGYLYAFSLTAPVELHRLIIAAGIGEKNATGFGWVNL